MRIWRLVTAAVCGVPALVGSALAQTAPASPPNVAAAVAKVQAFYNQVTTFRATFQQTYFVKAYNVTKTSQGDVVFAKPGMMDWRYSNPAGNRIVSNGATVWVYAPAIRQAYTQTLGQSQYPAVLSFLTGHASLDAQCNFTLYPGAPLHFQGGYVLHCAPKQWMPAYERILFYVDAASSQVRRVLILDDQGNRNRFDFDNVQVNVPASPQQFVFTPPPGTTVVGGQSASGVTGAAAISPAGSSPSPPRLIAP